ncbi:MAG: hypothetical protein R3E32_16360 [Chitinophagales bacterium]
MNITQMSIRQSIALILVCIAFTANHIAVAQPSQAYQIIKGIENQFPIPTPQESINVGTFDAATGKFTGLTTEIIRPGDFNGTNDVGGVGGVGGIGGSSGKPNIGSGGPLKPTKIDPHASVDAVNVELVFNVINRSGVFRVTADGNTGFTSNSNTVRINVGKATKVSWKVTSNNKSYSDVLNIKHNLVVSAGAFKVPALPVAVVYEPVPDRNNQNKATYTVTKSIGTKMQMSFSSTNSTKKPVTLPQFKGLATFKSILSGAATVLNKTQKPEAKAVAKVLGFVNDALGTIQSQQTKGTTVTNDGSLSISETIQNGFSTGANDGGPGVGDLIVYLQNVEMAWVAVNGEISLTLLNYERVSINSVQFLKAHLTNHPSGLTQETVQNLLKLDPFVTNKPKTALTNTSIFGGGPHITLDNDRFVKLGELEVNGVDYSQSFSHNITQTDTQSESNFTTTVTEFSKGFGSYIGIGVQENKTTTTSNVWAKSNSSNTSQTTSVGFSLNAEIDEIYAIEVYFDKVFGTFATQKVGLNQNPVLVGVATDNSGKVLKNKIIELQSGGQTFVTSTDAEGKYTFRSQNIKSKSGVLKAAGISKTVNFQTNPTTQPPKTTTQPPRTTRPTFTRPTRGNAFQKLKSDNR